MIGTFIVGSSVGNIYFVQLSTKSRAVSLRTTLAVSFKDCRQVLVDEENKAFYVLDSGDGTTPGRVLTLAPTELGTIEEKSACSTDLLNPAAFTMIGSHLYVIGSDAYAVMRGPRAPKTKRQRRTSKLEPLHEDSVAESLVELFAISKRTETLSSDLQEDAVSAIENIKRHIDSETASDVVTMGVVVQTDPLLKLMPDANEEYVFQLSRDRLTACRRQERDGTLLSCSSHGLVDAIDMTVDDESCFVLTRTHVVQMAVIGDGLLDEVKRFTLELDAGEVPETIHEAAYSLWIQCPRRVIKVHAQNGTMQSLPVACTALYLAPDGDMLVTATADALQLRDLEGALLGDRLLEKPASITRMS